MGAPKKRVSKFCDVCGNKFEVPYCRRKSAKYCSPKCKDAQNAKRHAEKRISIVCGQCGVEFYFPPCHADRRVYCSYKCHADAERGITPPPRAEGNVIRLREGYLLVRRTDHPFNVAGYVFQHRLIVEEWLREADNNHLYLVDIGGEKYLRREIKVHHCNEIRDDNGIENLLPCTNNVHASIHAAMKIVPSHLWPEIIKSVIDQAGLPPLSP